ncbi:hypothetical protein [Teichococcus aestuarii]|uniref:hypothetical protein n=1 Tax=Teichococcus aestuarii TaxID=568898 RepID=UPI0015E7EC59|nr:hypothetical protein [Pseudoroseomonas aestuarii]
MAIPGKAALLNELREQVARIKGHGDASAHPTLAFSIPAPDWRDAAWWLGSRRPA